MTEANGGTSGEYDGGMPSGARYYNMDTFEREGGEGQKHMNTYTHTQSLLHRGTDELANCQPRSFPLDPLYYFPCPAQREHESRLIIMTTIPLGKEWCTPLPHTRLTASYNVQVAHALRKHLPPSPLAPQIAGGRRRERSLASLARLLKRSLPPCWVGQARPVGWLAVCEDA